MARWAPQANTQRSARTRRSPGRPSQSGSVIGATETAPGRRRHLLTASCMHTASDVFAILIAGQAVGCPAYPARRLTCAARKPSGTSDPGRPADQLAGQLAVHLPGPRSGPADCCHTCPELLLCVRLKLRPCIRRAGHTGLPASRLSESGRHLCLRRSPARYTQADRGVEDSGHARGVLNAPAFTSSRSMAHQPRTGQEPMSFVRSGPAVHAGPCRSRILGALPACGASSGRPCRRLRSSRCEPPRALRRSPRYLLCASDGRLPTS